MLVHGQPVLSLTNAKRLDMPFVEFEDLPDSSRTWVFGADRSLDQRATDLLLGEVDRFLSQWHAHGSPLTAARDWKYGRFLTVAVDQSTAARRPVPSTDCSDRSGHRAELGASLVPSGLAFTVTRKGRLNQWIASGLPR